MYTRTIATLGAFTAGIALCATTAACMPDAPAPIAPPAVSVEAPPTITPAPLTSVTLLPCAQEDGDDCYWDPALMGNGTGTSFIRMHGVTYYPEG